jgi:hypothetical protein
VVAKLARQRPSPLPRRESGVISNLPGLIQDDSVGLEHGVDITSHAGGIVGQGQGHGGAANDAGAGFFLLRWCGPGGR